MGESELAVECASEEGRDTTQKLGYIMVNGCGSFVSFPRQHVAGAKRAVNRRSHAKPQLRRSD